MFENHFNSIKVRLNRGLRSVARFENKFQFHKGTIKPYFLRGVLGLLYAFQFHKGTIKPREL